jgi:hypothetical protein
MRKQSLLVFGVLSTVTQAQVYVCNGPHGETVYTDHGCRVGHTVDLSDIEIVDIPPLSAEERARLANLDLRSDKIAARRARSRARSAAENGAANASRVAACDAARSGLRRLRDTRRKGYALAQGKQLDAQEAAYKAARREHCG